MELGKNIAKIRKDNNLTQDDLAEKYFVTRQTISNWENGKSYPDLETLVKISNDFKISLDILLKEDNKMVKDISKKQKRYKWIIIPIILYAILVIGIIVSIPWLISQQYNSHGVSHFLVIHVDPTVPKTYIGELDNHKVYIESLDINDTNFRNFNAENVSIKEAIDKELVSIKEWEKYSWYTFQKDDTKILRYENYEIAITKDECIIRPISNNKSIDIKCHKDNTYRITLKEGNTFDCRLLDKDYSFKIKSINKDSIVITASDYGLTKVKDKGIDLKTKEKEFVIEKSQKVEITTQSMDYNESMILEWY